MKHKLIITMLVTLSLLNTEVSGETMVASASTDSLLDIGNIQHMQSVISQLDQRLKIYPQDHEASLLKALLYFRSGDAQQAYEELEQLISRAPDFHLAHLLKGDVLLSRVREVSDIGNAGLLTSLSAEKQQQLNRLRSEARVRLRALLDDAEKRSMPRQILAVGESIDHILLVDKNVNRLYVYEKADNQQGLKLVRDVYVSTGKLIGNKFKTGDLKTPEGVYFVTSWIPPEKLPDKYGVGAFPVNYPNELDKHRGKTGYGIWLHGTDKGYYSRPPRDSEGCVVLTNADLSSLKSSITPGVTPVIIADRVDWLAPEQWQKEREKILAIFSHWEQDWESMDVDRYLSHYSGDFWSGRHNYRSWSARKKMLAKNKTWQKVEISDLSMFVYPDSTSNEEIIIARFRQKYDSNNYSGDMTKRIYMKKEQQSWRIWYEGR